MRIQKLPIAIANQIAAGEVIERPASIVKELLENSLDAKATAIHIDIHFGGLNQVKVSDNGLGILAEDLPLAIAPHATSKINQLKDLYSIASMGFRGEALASIASVSRLTISSKPPEQKDAMMLICNGEDLEIRPCARSQGTTIDVRDIFFNAPVRKKFLKTERLEYQAIEMIVKRFALGAPGVGISLSHNDKKLLHLAGAQDEQSRVMRIRKIFGKSFIEQAIYIDVEQSGMRLWGWVANSDYQRSQNDKQWIYVNMRMVKDKLLNHAMKQGYESFLHPGRHSACLLYLDIKPEEVDVNVHPTKHEVRFQQSRLVHDFVSSQIQRVLQSSKKIESYNALQSSKDKILAVRESSMPDFISKHTPNVTESKNWINLHSPYVFVTLKEESYLVDMISLHGHWLKSQLLEQAFPFSRRPLLVPITHELSQFNLQHFQHCQQQLNQLGIELDLVAEKTVFIRSLPVAIPHLDLKQFLTAIFKEQPLTHLNLMELVIKYQTFDPKNATSEEKEALMTYMQTEVVFENVHKFFRHLSSKLCWELLNA